MKSQGWKFRMRKYTATCERITPGKIGDAKLEVSTTKTVLMTVPDQFFLRVSIKGGTPSLSYRNRETVVSHFQKQVDELITPKNVSGRDEKQITI